MVQTVQTVALAAVLALGAGGALAKEKRRRGKPTLRRSARTLLIFPTGYRDRPDLVVADVPAPETISDAPLLLVTGKDEGRAKERPMILDPGTTAAPGRGAPRE